MNTLRKISFLDDIVALRRDIHAYPEIAFDERRTAAIVAERLKSYGLTVHEGIAGTGVVGVLKKGDSTRAIGLRADMDALPIQEKNEFSHRSTHAGIMHACGHDGHTAMLLGAARYAAEHVADLSFEGSVYFIFQPAEESGGGALQMVNAGLFERFPMQAVFGLHNWPDLPAGEIAMRVGPMMAGTSTFEIKVQGRGGHAGMPHQGVDPIVVASHLVIALQTIVSREIHPGESAVVSVTQVHGGDAFNVIPDVVEICGTLRVFKSQVRVEIERAMLRICEGIGGSFGAQISLSIHDRYPPTLNHPEPTHLCMEVANSLVGADRLRTDQLPSMGAEDFSFMLEKCPGCYVWLGGGHVEGALKTRGLHNPHYDFNDETLALGMNYWVSLIERALAPERP